VKKAADRFEKAGGIRVEVWTFAEFRDRIANLLDT
jgi:hypothetical protein